jgi:serine/threonine protein kinase
MAKRTIEHYEIVRWLGAGGSGVVFLATDTLLQRPVVLKILRSGILPAEKLHHCAAGSGARLGHRAPQWNNLRTNSDFERILEDLKKSWRRNQRTWKRLLEQVPAQPQ